MVKNSQISKIWLFLLFFAFFVSIDLLYHSVTKASMPSDASMRYSDKMENYNRSRHLSDSLAQKPKIRGAIVYLISKSRLKMLRTSIRMLFFNFNNAFEYPILLFYEEPDFAGHETLLRDIQGWSELIELVKLTDFDRLPPQFTKETVPEKASGFSLGYRFMCQFWARTVFRYLSERNIEYYWRMDTDSFLLSPIRYDVFKWMRANNVSYGYALDSYDPDYVIEGLWSTILKGIEYSSNSSFHWDLTQLATFSNKRLETVDLNSLKSSQYSSKIYYNNFEISRVDMWTSTYYDEIFRWIDESGGIFLNRWGDAPIRTLALSLLQPIYEKRNAHSSSNFIWKFEDFLYSHPPNVTAVEWLESFVAYIPLAVMLAFLSVVATLKLKITFKTSTRYLLIPVLFLGFVVFLYDILPILYSAVLMGLCYLDVYVIKS